MPARAASSIHPMAKESAMKFGGFLHLNIRCSERDLPAIERFYGDVLGLKKGYRPNFTFGGIWLYDGDDPIVHVSARFPEGYVAKNEKHSGSVDHIAFKASGAADFRKLLKRLGVTFEEQNIPNAGYQVFLHDPVGTKLEFNFLDEQVADAVPSGTTAQTNLVI
jgi:catechol 2,3-dioxygenase-like lactoylglutathione lyase family enzyme